MTSKPDCPINEALFMMRDKGVFRAGTKGTFVFFVTEIINYTERRYLL